MASLQAPWKYGLHRASTAASETYSVPAEGAGRHVAETVTTSIRAGHRYRFTFTTDIRVEADQRPLRRGERLAALVAAASYGRG